MSTNQPDPTPPKSGGCSWARLFGMSEEHADDDIASPFCRSGYQRRQKSGANLK